jgi:lysylphosphatidylglycerol synthetase-like protein (DUF2156 family)
MGTLVPALIQHQGFLIWPVCRDLEIGVRRYCAEVYAPVLPGVIAGAALTAFLRPMLPLQGHGIGHLALIAAIAGAVCAVSIGSWAAVKAVANGRIRALAIGARSLA